MTDTSLADHVPLANWQKLRLLYDCVPFIGFAIIVLAVLTLFGSVIGVGISSILFRLFISFVLVVLGFQAVQRIRDLISGQANVVVDILERSWRSGGSGRGIYFGKFQQLGRIRVIGKAHFGSHNGQRYRVTYSPISRIVWTLEPVT
jgi:hypothetical protein